MTGMHLLYNLIGSGAALLAGPVLWLRWRNDALYSERLRQRMGYYPPEIKGCLQVQPRIWLHAVSVGEVGVAQVIMDSLERQIPGCQIALSTTTVQGMARARALLGTRAFCFYAPADLYWTTRRALATIRPNILALLETEIWPNLIINANRMGIRTAFVNGRISVRSINAYRRIRPLLRHSLSHVDAFSMISEPDAGRIRSLGAPDQRVMVNGNAKFDGGQGRCTESARIWARDAFGLHADTPVFVAGSTRSGEEQILIEAFLTIRRHLPRTVFILAPRHIERAAQIEQLLHRAGLPSQRRSTLQNQAQQRQAPVVILDTMGELFDVYGIADVVFCGGSLVPKGGQNLLEPAMWGKPILHGPSMEDFAEAHRLIATAGGSVTVRNAEQAAGQAIKWLNNPHKAAAVGSAARRAIAPHRGAAEKHAAVIGRLLREPLNR